MHKLMRGSALGTTLLASLIIAAPVAARAITTADRHFTFSEHPRFDCGTFTIDGDWIVTVIDTVVFAPDGTPIQEIQHIQFDGTLSAPSGRTIRDIGRFNNVFDLVDGSWRSSGGRHDSAPSLGWVLQDSGAYRFDPGDVLVFSAGNLFDQNGSLERLCAYMSGG